MLRLPHNRRSRIQLALVLAFIAAFYFGARYVSNWVEAGADFQQLEHAVQGGDLEQLERQLRESAHIDVRDPESRKTALHVAAEYGQVESAKFLLDHGADPNATDENLATPLLYAVGTSHQIVELLIEHGANVNMSDDPGITPLHYAARQGKMNVVQTLIGHGAELHTWATGYDDTPAGLAMSVGHTETAEYILFDAGQGDLNDEKSFNLLSNALANDRFDLMQRILDADANSANVTRGRISATVVAVIRRSPKELREAVLAGETVNDMDGFGWVPILALAATMNEPEIVVYLLDCGLDPNFQTTDGDTALHAAARTDAADAARVLIERGASMELRASSARMTPAHYAVRHQSVNVLRLLIQNGANTQPISKRPWGTPLEMARKELDSLRIKGNRKEDRDRLQSIIKILENAAHTQED